VRISGTEFSRRPEFLVVGSGLTGAVMARQLVDAGRSVLVLDRRPHVGGNVFDHVHASGVRVHTYGPHYFRTRSDDVWRFVNRFAAFYRYEACLQSRVEGGYANWPIAGSYIRRTVGDDWRPEFAGTPGNFEQAALSLMPRAIYETFVKEYNEKQWGVPATALRAELCRRFDVRHDDGPRLTPHHAHQGLPVDGYANMMRRMLDGIPVELGVDYLADRERFRPAVLTIFTGPIDAYFDHALGRLHYRGQRRETTYLPGVDRHQPAAQINEPRQAGGAHIRTLEWKQMMQPHEAAKVRGTVVTTETPYSPTDADAYEYPFPDDTNRALDRRYRAAADGLNDVLICGRLGEYQYFDMDHAIARALTLARRLITGRTAREILRGAA
jgi:UDP-galactopyranose mutase